MTEFATLVVDPPWPHERHGGGRGRHLQIGMPYDCMTLREIEALPMAALAAENAHLFLWVTPALYRQGTGVSVAQAWGFSVVGEIMWKKPSFGMGGFPRPQHEPLLICRRGRLAFSGGKDVGTVQEWRQTYVNGAKWHSAKPEGSYTLIERVSPGPYVDVFARQTRMGWSIWPETRLEASA